MNQPTRSTTYLSGLNGLRFIAAFFVLMQHAHESLANIGWAVGTPAIFDRGRPAVDFFFTLSGFLITYVLVRERHLTNTISLKRFYLRRAARIWPLYFIIVAVGFVLFAVIYPRIFHTRYFDFNVAGGLALYLVFLPNLIASFHKVGMLLPLWSIGVEEQYYLMWAPLMKWFGNRLLRLILIFLAVTFAFHAITESGLIAMSPGMWAFLHTLRFHYMAIGSLCGWILYRAPDDYKRSFFATYTFQGMALACLSYYYLVGFNARGEAVLLDLVLGLLYGTLILNVSSAPKRLIRLEWEPLVYLGKISYGIYMYHMTVDYGLRLVVVALGLRGHISTMTALVYMCVLLLVTVLIAHLSFEYIESYFIRKGAALRGASPPDGDSRRDASAAVDPARAHLRP